MVKFASDWGRDQEVAESNRADAASVCREAPGFDLVVFDEAHKLSWTDPNRGDSKTLRYQLAETLARCVPNLLLLTATPHMGKEFPYFAIWRLLDPGVFSTPESVRTLTEEKRNRHFIRRLKEEMVAYDGQPIYKPRLAQTIPVSLREATRACGVHSRAAGRSCLR